MNGTTSQLLPASLPGPMHEQVSPGQILCNLPTPVNAVCQLKDLGESAVGTAANSAFDNVVDTMGEDLASLFRLVLTWWVNLPSPQLAGSSGEPGPVLASIREYTSGLQVILMSAGILFAAARMAVAKRGGLAGEAQESFLMFARAVFASMMFSALITAGTKAGDAFSNWVIFDATRGDLDSAVGRIVDVEMRTTTGLGAGIGLILFILGLISMLVQLVMLILRQVILILVVAAIPLAAAAAGTGPGSQAYKRMVAWGLAFVLWKPVGALVYAIAFTAAGNENQDTQLTLLGILLLLSVTIVLPALMRLIAPAVATLGGGGGAAAALAGGAVGAGMGASGGERSNVRKMSEGENSAGNSGAGGGGAPPPPAPSGGGGGRPLGGGSAATPSSGASGGSESGGGGGAVSAGGQGAAAGKAGSAAAAGGAAAGGPAGAGIMAASGVKQAVQQAGSAVGSRVGEGTQHGWDMDRPGPLEVRR